MARYQVGIETRKRILEATRSLLGEIGLEGTTLKAICDRAGVLAGSFYNQFASKDEAVMEVVREAVRSVDPHPQAVASDTVADLVAAYVEFITGDPTVARIYLQVAVGGGFTDEELGARILGQHRRRVERLAAALVRERPAVGEAGAALRAEAALATLNGLTLQYVLDPDLDLAAHAELMVAAALGTSEVAARG